MNNLYIMSGPPGCGKSTYIKNHYNPTEDTWVSRDEIRFGYLNDTDDYFQNEDRVFKEFVKHIQDDLVHGNVYADATHLNERSRNKLLRNLDLHDVKVYVIQFFVPFKVCWERNKKRDGRSVVPKGVLRRMWFSQADARADSGIYPFEVITIEEEEGRQF